MKLHLSAGFWNSLFKKMDEQNMDPELVRRGLQLNSSTFYLKRRQYRRGGVLPRKPGSGRKRSYQIKDYEPLIRETLQKEPPIAGHKRIWHGLRLKGLVPFSLNTMYRMLRELGLLVPHNRGRCYKKYEPLRVEGPGQLWVADTTTWWIKNRRVEIYVALDAHSRWIPGALALGDRTAISTTRFYEQILDGGTPVTIHTDNGPEFVSKNARAYLEDRNVGWQHGPSYTPQAQGLVERVIKTLKEEWLMWKEPKDEFELQESLNEFVTWYNSDRVHSALGYQTPEVVHCARQ